MFSTCTLNSPPPPPLPPLPPSPSPPYEVSDASLCPGSTMQLTPSLLLLVSGLVICLAALTHQCSGNRPRAPASCLRSACSTASLAQWSRRPPRERKIPGFRIFSLAPGFFRGRVVPVTHQTNHNDTYHIHNIIIKLCDQAHRCFYKSLNMQVKK